MIICKADGTEHEDRDALHKYLRRLRVKQETYYTEHEPRFDLFSGEPIPFTSASQYLTSDFINKHNIKKLIKQRPEEAKKWAVGWLQRRREEKNLIYPPTHVELRTLMCPTVRYYNAVGGYQKICAELGYKTRYEGQLAFKPLDIEQEIIQDTREQKPLQLDHPTRIATLNVGDYAIDGSKVVIERKGLNDFVSTITTKKPDPFKKKKVGIERFRAELDRARAAGIYLIMLVEESIGNAVSFNYLPHMRYTKATPDHVFKNLRDLLIEYADCFQTVFVASRHEAAQAIVKLFEAGETVKTVDLHFEYEEGRLI